MDQFPSAVLLARLEDVKLNNNVLYRLVRPTETGTQVESVGKMVNVVPFRRIYRFDRKDELNDFKVEVLKRPLVLQPVVHFGRGLGSGSLACGMCYKDDKWVLLVNQTHPKILSRLQIGLDAAKNAIMRGQSFEIRFSFIKVVQEMYRRTLTKNEQEAASTKLDLFKSYFRYAEWEYGDLILRYHGYGAMLGRGGGLREIATMHLTFDFEDLTLSEIVWKSLGAEYFPKSHLAPITEDEIREVLPAWTINSVSPLEDIGEQIPAESYSYAQAGKLYESFRKKKRWQRQERENSASGGLPAAQPGASKDIELKVYDDEYQHEPTCGDGVYQNDIPVRQKVPYKSYAEDDRSRPTTWQERHNTSDDHDDDGFDETPRAAPSLGAVAIKVDVYGHMYPDIRVRATETGRSKGQLYENVPPRFSTSSVAASSSASPLDYTDTGISQFTRRHLQGSDRSSYSEAGSSGATDSGVYSDSDGHNKESVSNKLYTKGFGGPTSKHRYAMDNMAFHSDEDEIRTAVQKHKEMVAKMVAGAQHVGESKSSKLKPDHHFNKQQGYYSHGLDRVDNLSVHAKNKEHYSDLQYGHSSKGGYVAGQNEYKSYGARQEPHANHKKRAQSDSQGLVEESFI